MLCLDESTPVVMALCLLGAVLFIVGGSFWGSGDYSNDRQKTVAGITMFSVSLLLLVLAGLGCYCNRFFCTPDRKSRIALRLYGSRPPLPAADDVPEDASTAGGSERVESVEAHSKDPDWEEYAGSSSYRSFRSGRNSTRGRSKRASFRRDKVTPAQPIVNQGALQPANNRASRMPQPPPQPPPGPPQSPPHYPAKDYAPISAKNGHRMVPVEFASPTQQEVYTGDAQTVMLNYRSRREVNQQPPSHFRTQQPQQQQQQQPPYGNPANRLGYQQQNYNSTQPQVAAERHQQHQQLTVTPHTVLQPVDHFRQEPPHGGYVAHAGQGGRGGPDRYPGGHSRADGFGGSAGGLRSPPQETNQSGTVSHPMNV